MLNLLISIIFSLFTHGVADNSIVGAWENTENGHRTIYIFQDGYYTLTTFNDTAFISTQGGTFSVEKQAVILKEEFSTVRKEVVTETLDYKITNHVLTLGKNEYNRIDNGVENIAGTWRITGRKIDGEMKEIQHTGSRKTLKILSSNRFQWFAINPDGNQFFGTGGGTYTFKDGTYTENIEFFSRDPKRVGQSLSFDGKIEEGRWHHSGLSSKGDKIYEIWERLNF